MKRFKYDVVKLIVGVRDRPCLWNKYIENYKDRVERKQAWNEIFNILDKRYEEMSPDDKRLTSETVISKWTNIRDTFVKSLRHKPGKSKKQYVLYEHLKFLIPIIPEPEQQEQTEQDNLGYTEDQPTSSLVSFLKGEVKEKDSYNDITNSAEYEICYEDSEASTEPEASSTPVVINKERSSKRKRSRKDSQAEEVDESKIDFVSMDEHRLMNEDEAFFASLLPTIVKYNEDERLEFRIEVLSLMKKIKEKRKWSSGMLES